MWPAENSSAGRTSRTVTDPSAISVARRSRLTGSGASSPSESVRSDCPVSLRPHRGRSPRRAQMRHRGQQQNTVRRQPRKGQRLSRSPRQRRASHRRSSGPMPRGRQPRLRRRAVADARPDLRRRQRQPPTTPHRKEAYCDPTSLAPSSSRKYAVPEHLLHCRERHRGTRASHAGCPKRSR